MRGVVVTPLFLSMDQLTMQFLLHNIHFFHVLLAEYLKLFKRDDHLQKAFMAII